MPFTPGKHCQQSNLSSASGERTADSNGSRAERSSTRTARVMVVDDNRDASDMLSTLLDAIGMETAVAIDGFDCLRQVEQFRPDIIFMDIGMPGLSGYDTVVQLRRMPGMAQVVIVAVTGWGDPESRARTKEAGFNLHLTKPASIDDIVKVVFA